MSGRILLLGAGASGSSGPPSDLAVDLESDGVLWQDNARTTPVTADAQAIGAWDDLLSGLSYIQATAGLRPLYKINQQNGKPSVRFDGSNDVLTAALFAALNNATGYSLFVAFKIASGAGNQLVCTCVPTANPRACSIQVTGGGLNQYADTSNANFGTVAFVDSTTVLWEALYDGTQPTNATKLRCWKNGVAQSLTFTGTVPAALGAANTGFSVGCDSGGVRPFGGDLFTVCLYPRTLSNAERLLVETDINTKLAIF